MIGLTDHDIEAIAERVVARLRGTGLATAPALLTCNEFAQRIGRKVEYVQDRCRIGRIKTIPGKPYRIPVEEVTRWIREQ